MSQRHRLFDTHGAKATVLVVMQVGATDTAESDFHANHASGEFGCWGFLNG